MNPWIAAAAGALAGYAGLTLLWRSSSWSARSKA
jgi:hypothetical protein